MKTVTPTGTHAADHTTELCHFPHGQGIHHFFTLLLVFGLAFGAALAFGAPGALGAGFASGVLTLWKNFLSFLYGLGV